MESEVMMPLETSPKTMDIMNIEAVIRTCPVNWNNTDMFCVQPNPLTHRIQLANSHEYQFNQVLPMNMCQESLFTATVAPMLNYFCDGCDVSIVTFGQSGTGKTYTILGPGFDCASSETDHGIIPRFIREVFKKMMQHRDRNWTAHITWSQICGETVQDLLGVGSMECGNISDVFQLIQVGMSNINPKGAHTLFTLTLEQQWTVDGSRQHHVSTASFADLAGSEKVLVYDSNGCMQTIPTDLSIQTLQRCIFALSEGGNQYFVPYSQSVLTTLLKDSFGGRAKTLLLCCISPLMQDYTETLYTLQLALRAQLVRNYVTVNSYTTFENPQENCDVFGLQFAANQLRKLVSNAEELFQKLVSHESLPKTEQEQISQWLILKQECEDCISENSEPHHSLERIDEEENEAESSSNTSDVEEDNKESLMDRVQTMLESFQLNVDKLVSKTNVASLPKCEKAKSSPSLVNEYHVKGARGRRGSIYSVDEFQPSSLDASKISELSTERPQSKKKHLKQVKAALDLNGKEIEDLEKTIKVKENLRERLLKHKDTKSSAHDKIELKCQILKRELKNVELKLLQARTHKNPALEEKYRSETAALEEKLRDAEFLKNVTEDGSKLLELATSLHTSRKKLAKLKKYKLKKETLKKELERQCKAENKSMSSTKSLISTESALKSSQARALALFDSRAFSPRDDPESLGFRLEIKKLRKAREYFLEQRCRIAQKSPPRHHKKALTEIEERKLLQYEETVEAIDVIIEYKNMLICRHDPQLNDVPKEKADRMLMERFLKLSELETRLLLRRYFEKTIELRNSSKSLEGQILEVENQNDNLIYAIRDLNHTLGLVRSEAERRIILLQQQYEERLCLLLQILGEKAPVSAAQLGLSPKQADKSTKVPAIAPAPQARVTRAKNRIILQKHS